MTKNLLFLAPLLATAAIAVGCGGGDSYVTKAASEPAAARSEATGAATPTDSDLPTSEPEVNVEEGGEAAAAAEVKMAGSTFAPGEIEMKVGETVKFVNDDEIAHTATADDGAFDSGTIEPGGTFEFTAEQAGTISYLCEFHPGMTGTIKVS